jgi:hypothetical protein
VKESLPFSFCFLLFRVPGSEVSICLNKDQGQKARAGVEPEVTHAVVLPRVASAPCAWATQLGSASHEGIFPCAVDNFCPM